MRAVAIGDTGTIGWKSFVVIAVGVLVAACGSSPGTGSPPPPASAGPSSSAVAPSTTAAPTSVPSTTAPRPPLVPVLRAGYLPLWPFSSGSDVVSWQRSYRSRGHQPWHRSADMTALAFSSGFLGYTEIDRVTTRAGIGQDALIGVGWLNPNKQAVTVATIHLLKYGSDADSPWEVVGTRDTRLSLTTPRYGSAVSSPMRVGGRITGVDENLRAVVHSLGSSIPVGRAAPLPAGGQNQPWSTTVGFAATEGTVLTVAVSTGGHLAGVEAFAVTGVRAAATSAAASRVIWGSPATSGPQSGAPLMAGSAAPESRNEGWWPR